MPLTTALSILVSWFLQPLRLSLADLQLPPSSLLFTALILRGAWLEALAAFLGGLAFLRRRAGGKGGSNGKELAVQGVALALTMVGQPYLAALLYLVLLLGSQGVEAVRGRGRHPLAVLARDGFKTAFFFLLPLLLLFFCPVPSWRWRS